MPKAIDYAVGTVVPDTWLDDMQEVDSPSLWGARISKVSASNIEIPVAQDGSATGQGSGRFNGRMMYWTAPLVSSFIGKATGTYNVYLEPGPPGDTVPDLTVVSGAGGAGARKIGEVDWEGSGGSPANTITKVRNMADAVSGHGYLHRADGPDPLPTAAAVSLTSATVNGEGVSLSYARADHTHTLDSSIARSASPVFSGTPTAPTAAADTNTTQIATTAFVVGQAASVASPMNSVAAVGTSLRYARQDHVHATDTSRAPTASPTFTGTVTAATIAATGLQLGSGGAVASAGYLQITSGATNDQIMFQATGGTVERARFSTAGHLVFGPAYLVGWSAVAATGTPDTWVERRSAGVVGTAKLIVGATAPTSTALLSAVGDNGLEFGHSNSAGYRGALGSQASNGVNFLAFHSEAGTTGNTYRTRGVRATILRADLSGGFDFGNVASANADNQAFASLLTLTGDGHIRHPAGVFYASPSGIRTLHSLGNLYLDARRDDATAATGGIYLNWNFPGSVVFGNGAASAVATMSSAGNLSLVGLTASGTITGANITAFTGLPSNVGLIGGTADFSGYVAWTTPNGVRQGYMGFDANNTGISLTMEQGTFKVNGQRISQSTRWEGHTWAVAGEIKVAAGDTDYIPPMYTFVNTTETLSIHFIRYRINAGTSVTFDLRRRTAAGVESNVAANLVAVPGDTGAAVSVALADADKIYPIVTAVSGTPKNLSVSVGFNRTAGA